MHVVDIFFFCLYTGQNIKPGEEMTIKQQVLKQLENHKGEYISGNKLAETLYVSRNAVWKAVRSLTADGHDIQAVTNKGYRLAPSSDVLSSAAIEKHITRCPGVFEIAVHKTLSSTNATAKQLAAKGSPEGTVIIAEEQTDGRGRFGRSFYSPAQSGVYLSLLLRPKVVTADATLLTTAAAVAVAQAIDDVTGTDAQIKWVNDIFCDGKKVCGILTEGSFDIESGALDYAVVGIGLNITPPAGGFPEQITDIAASVCNTGDASSGLSAHLVAEILQNFWGYYLTLSDKTYLKDYKARSMILGKDVDVISAGTKTTAHTLDIDDDCHLIVRFDDGSVKALSSGEVSIRPKHD